MTRARPITKITTKVLSRSEIGNDPNDHRDDPGYLARAESTEDRVARSQGLLDAPAPFRTTAALRCLLQAFSSNRFSPC